MKHKYYWSGSINLSGIVEAETYKEAVKAATEALQQTSAVGVPKELDIVIPASEVNLEPPVIFPEQRAN